MKVETFDTAGGLYLFEVEAFETSFHAHPAVEIILAKKGMFTICTNNEEYSNLKVAVIAANQPHQLLAYGCNLRIMMIEHRNSEVKNTLALSNEKFLNGYFSHSADPVVLDRINRLIDLVKSNKRSQQYDSRVEQIIDYIAQHDLEYSHMIPTLQTITQLSESRISHIFKANIGISLKKYLIWTKLKKTVLQHLEQGEELFSALINSGFYDQPHFSRNFKTMLGIQPSKAYNSRNVQVLPKLSV